MKKNNAIIILITLLLIIVLIGMFSYMLLLTFLILLIILEISSYFLINKLREDFQWLITPKDEIPELDKEGINKFMKHGYDPELGWVRKPNTQKEEIGKEKKTSYHIGADGARKNPGHEKLKKEISCYGDSFAFSRQVDDNDTWEWYLSELTKTNVMNFGIGNHGLDQALLRLKREYKKNKTKIVFMAVVPSTIVRILSAWKHYNEFGNTFGFKPRFILKDGKLKLIKNIIDSRDKFLKYKQYLPQIRKYDYFYLTKFKTEMIRFPYFVSILSDPLRNIPLIFLVSKDKWFKKEAKKGYYPPSMNLIMDINLKLRYKIFKKDKKEVRLLEKIIEEFVRYGNIHNFIPMLIWMPQKDDLLFIKREKKYYDKFIKGIKSKLFTIDLTEQLINRKDLDELYSDDNKYGGHYSKFGNKVVAESIYKELKKMKL